MSSHISPALQPPTKTSSHFSKKEKTLILNVQQFNEKEKTKFSRHITNDHERDLIQRITIVPFEQVNKRTAAMTGCSERSLYRFMNQFKSLELTPKKPPGKKSIHVQEWMLADIRQIITGWALLIVLNSDILPISLSYLPLDLNVFNLTSFTVLSVCHNMSHFRYVWL